MAKARSGAALSDRQRSVMNFIAAFMAAEGYSPTLEEIRAHLGVAAVSTVHHHVACLMEKGYLSRTWNRDRSLVPGPRAPRTKAMRLVPVTGIVSRGIRVISRARGGEIAVGGELARWGASYALRVRTNELEGEGIRRGDTLLVEAPGRGRPGTLVVLSGGAGRVLARIPRAGGGGFEPVANGAETWRARDASVHGVVVGLLRRDP